MKILVIGAGKEKSLGTLLRNSLPEHEIVLTSRHPEIAGTEPCNITVPEEVDHIIEKHKPEYLILAAGVYPEPAELGQISDWKAIDELVRAKVLGCLIALNAAVKCDVRHVIALAGSIIHTDHSLMFYSLVNGGIYAAMRSMEVHKKVQCTYIELGPVPGSTMGDLHLSRLTEGERTKIQPSSMEDLTCVIRGILRGQRDGPRFLLDCKIKI